MIIVVAGAGAVLLVVWLAMRDGGQGLAALGGGQRIPAISYRVEDADTIAVVGLTGDGAWSRITNVVETPTDVQVSIRALHWPGSWTYGGQRIEWTVDLARPIGDRTVTDGFQALPQQ